MENRPADGCRTDFRIIIQTTPTLIVSYGTRWCVYMYNEGSRIVHLGSKATVLAGANHRGLDLPIKTAIMDSYSCSEWYGRVDNGTGIISGYIVN